MGYRLRIVAGPGLGSEVALNEPEITIGRAPENGLVINDNNVSRVHAKLMVGDRIVVLDNGSRNGVYVNDRKVNQQPIGPGDRLVIGQTVMELVSDAPMRPASGGARPVPPRPGPGTAGRTPSPPPNGRGNAVAVVRGPPPATRGNQQMARTGAVKQAGRPGAKPPQQGGMSKMGMLAVGGVVLVFVVFALASGLGGSGGKKNLAGGNDLPKVTQTPPIIPGLNSTQPQNLSAVSKCAKKAQENMDLGDSLRDSNNLKASRDAFKSALKVDPSCLSASVRLKAVVDRIEAKIIEYEKAGQQAYDSGDFKRAIQMWEIAIEFIADARDPRTPILKTRIEQSRKLIQKQPQ